MKFRSALRAASQAARANLLPGLLLQCLMLVFLSAYVSHEGTRAVLAEVARVKGEVGYLFALVSYIFAAALLPEALKVMFFQGGRATRDNARSLAAAVPIWGAMGVLVDLFYRYQVVWFGSGSDFQTIAKKVIVDQFVFSPFVSNPFVIGAFMFCTMGFTRATVHEMFRWEFLTERVFPVQVAGWCIWIPGVALIYFMPSLLQIPVAALIQCFWVLIFTTLQERHRRVSMKSATQTP